MDNKIPQLVEIIFDGTFFFLGAVHKLCRIGRGGGVKNRQFFSKKMTKWGEGVRNLPLLLFMRFLFYFNERTGLKLVKT